MSFTAAPPLDIPMTTIHSHDGRAMPWGVVGGSNAYPLANMAVYVPFSIGTSVTVYETWVETGTLTTSNAVEIGVFDTSGTRLFTSTLTVAVASTVVNSSGMTDFVLGAGTYYLAMGCDGTRNFLGATVAGGMSQAVGIMEQTGLTGAALPSTWTPAGYTRGVVPIFGLNLRNIAI